MEKILFVCLGNICRSPVAEGIMLHLKNKYDLPLEVDSAGTAGYHINEPPDRRTVTNAKKNGIDLSLLRARQFNISDFDRFDKIYVMDNNNLKHLQGLSKNKSEHQKIELLLKVTGHGTYSEVPDPYYGTADDFELVFRILFEACKNLCEKIRKQ